MKVLGALLVVLALARPAAAQLCHVGDVDDAGEHGEHAHGHHGHHGATRPATHVQLALTTDVATIDRGSYQGVIVAGSVHRGRFGARIAVPYWRLDVLDTPHTGLGDLVVQGHARLLGDDRASAGAVLAVGLPTGKASYGLGMGHAMVMPALWATAARGRARALILLGGGKSLGGGHDHAGFPDGPPVSPMAPLEADLTVRATYNAAPGLALDAIGAVAVPLGDDRRTRAAAGLGARYRRGGWLLGASALAGVAGDPFTARLVVDVARRL